ncbi:MAG: PA0069 family radical SAM protein [Bacteroidota bacterium]
MLPLDVKGRGAGFNPPNRFEELHVGAPPEDLARYFEAPDPDRKILTRYYFDHTKSILASNDSPDVGFTYSLNPYRGCEHGCIYCYARPSHEYLGFSSGIDFETKILVKTDAAGLLEDQFNARSWKPEVVVFSGNTDCYQPIERKLGITRGCLEVFSRFRNPLAIITKNALVQRDIDILKELAAFNLVVVVISVTSLNAELIRKMEPRTSTPVKRLETIEALARHGIPVGVNVAPLIPGLTDSEMPAILKEAADRGATSAGHTLVRLPLAVKDLFVEWVERELPDSAAKILNRIRSVRDGKMSESEFGKRMTGEGPIAEAIEQLFAMQCRRYGLNRTKLRLSTEHFRHAPRDQFTLF